MDWPLPGVPGPRHGQDSRKLLSFSGELYIGHGPPWLRAAALCRPGLHSRLTHAPANREDAEPRLLPAAKQRLSGPSDLASSLGHRLHSQEAEGHFWDARPRDCPGFHVLPSMRGQLIKTSILLVPPALDRGHQHLNPDAGSTISCPCHGWDPAHQALGPLCHG